MEVTLKQAGELIEKANKIAKHRGYYKPISSYMYLYRSLF